MEGADMVKKKFVNGLHMMSAIRKTVLLGMWHKLFVTDIESAIAFISLCLDFNGAYTPLTCEYKSQKSKFLEEVAINKKLLPLNKLLPIN